MSQPAGEGVPTLELHDVSKALGQVIALRSGSLTKATSSRPETDYTVEANNTVVLGDPYKFNKDNIDQFKF
jgi:hypothetical protein